ncbi:carbohydrate sulfotransferase [Synechococcus sp. BOUM118]|nr:carbohydrate sulfotransferase [Synechococcus sp. BOUM118]
MSKSPRHFILFRDIPLLYGRVPKVANSSIKSALCKFLVQRPNGGIKTTADRFWREHTHGETQLLTPQQARRLRATHFSFSFVRNPFDRLVASYNNKILEIDDVPLPMKTMGLRHGMAFDQFIEIVCKADPDQMDNHVRPQAEILLSDNKLVPKFVGRMEHMTDHWRRLRRRMKLEGLPTLGAIPQKNVRREGRRDIRVLFHSTELIDMVVERYEQDFKRFYSDYSLDLLLDGHPLNKLPPLQRGVVKAKKRQRVQISA